MFKLRSLLHVRIFLPLFLVFLGIGNIGQAQPGIDEEWNYGGSSNDEARAIKNTKSGGFVLAGRSKSNDFDVSGNKGNWDFWVAKMDSSGNILWERNYGGSDEEDANSIYQTNDGGFIVAGFSRSASGDVSGNYGSTDYWVVKLDSTGNIEWENNYGGGNFDAARSVIQTEDGGYAVTGSAWSSTYDVSSNNGYDDIWTIKLDSTGTLLWEAPYGGSSYDGTHTVRQTKDGGYITTGYTQSSDGDISSYKGGGGDYWVVKMDSSGNLMWEDTYGGSDGGSGRCIEQLSGGGYILGGNTASSDIDVSANNGQEDFWVVRLDNNGNILWENNYGGSGTEEPSTVLSTSDGGFMIYGHTWSDDVDVSGNHGYADYWAVKLDNSGNMEWKDHFGGSNSEKALEGYLVQEAPDGSFRLAGFTGSTDGDVSTNHGGNDYWVVELFGPCDTVRVTQHPGPDTVCSGDSALFSVKEGGYYNNLYYEWQVNDGSGWAPLSAPSDDTLQLPNVTAADSGKLYRCIVSDSCGNVDTSNAAELTVSPAISFTTSIVDVSCYGDTNGQITITASGGTAPYRFSVDSGQNFSSIYADSVLTFIDLYAGGYDVLVQDTLGCQSSIVPDTVSQPPDLVANAGPNDTICPGDTTTIGGNPAASGGTGSYTYAWDPINGLSSPTIDTPQASPDSTTSYQLVVVDDSSCTDTSTVTVAVSTPPSPQIGTDTALCGTNDTLLLSVASGYASYQWSTGGSGPSIKVDSVGEVWVSVQDQAGCSGTDSIPVGLDSSIRAVITQPAQALTCSNNVSMVLKGDSSSYKSGPLAFQWSTSTGSISGSTSSDSVTVQDSGAYKLLVKDQSTGCRDSTSTTLSLDTLSPSVSILSPDSLGCGGDSVLLEASDPSGNTDPSMLEYLWNIASGSALSGYGRDSVRIGETGEHELIVTDTSNGCGDTDRVKVVRDCQEITVYNAFTPDGDGSNDTWWIVGIEAFPDNSVRIMNRWGDEVNRFEGYDNREVVWEGNAADGSPLPPGTYYYVIDPGGEKEAMSGWVQITK